MSASGPSGYLLTIGKTHVLVPRDQVAHVGRRVLVQLLVITKDEDGNVDGAEHGELVRLLEQATLALQEGPSHYVSLQARDLAQSRRHCRK